MQKAKNEFKGAVSKLCFLLGYQLYKNAKQREEENKEPLFCEFELLEEKENVR